MLTALRNLATALKSDLLSQDEYDLQRAKIVAHDKPTIMSWQNEFNPASTELSSKVDELLTAIRPAAGPSKGAKYVRCQDMGPASITPVARPAGQNSLLSFGVVASERRKDGRLRQLVESDLQSRPHQFRCSFQGCHRTFSLKAHLSNHQKTHRGEIQKARSVMEMQSMRAVMSDAQLKAAVEVDIRFLVADCIDAACNLATVAGGWTKKIDGRRTNSGVASRQGRSYAFKAKVVKNYEQLCKQNPDWKSDMAGWVSDVHLVTADQVRLWFKNKDYILERAKNRALGKSTRNRKPKGRFQEAEAKVFELFKEERRKSRRVGPRWLRRTMLKEVRNLQPAPPMAECFNARSGWLRRFVKRHGLALRRKTNNKKIPIELRAVFLKRWFAVFKLWLLSHRGKLGYDEEWSIYAERYSVDQVPAGDFDPKTTYEVKGAKRVCIAANDAFDKHRWCTLQILIGNMKDPSRPRHGQPKLCICFRGTGQRISQDERGQYNEDVYVLFQPKAWFDSVTCNKYITEVAVHELSGELPRGQRRLILGDNLSGQTKKTNPEFSKLLDKLCNADFWSLLAGNTDEIQVVDAGFGKLVKAETEEVLTDWLKDDTNYEEWIGGRMSASRKRIMMTHWYAAGYERACAKFNFEEVFYRTGSNLSADGSSDDRIALQGLSDFSFSLDDANRDPKTGEQTATVQTTETARTAAAIADDSCDEANDLEEMSANEGSDDPGGATTDEELEGPDLDQSVEIEAEVPAEYPSCLIGRTIQHRYDDGWYTGVVQRQITVSTTARRNGKFACKFEDSSNEIDHALLEGDYGRDGHWVLLKK